MSSCHAFHLAFAVRDLDQTRAFYADLLGCSIGRESQRWIDFNFFGHQITAHLLDSASACQKNGVDGDAVPVPHFGAILDMDSWQKLADRLAAAGTEFEIGPRVRFRGQVGEQATMFLRDPSGNALEFKAFADSQQIFASS